MLRNSFLASLLALGCSSSAEPSDGLGSDDGGVGGASAAGTGGKGGGASGGKGGGSGRASTGGTSGTGGSSAAGGKGGTPSVAGKPSGSGGDSGEGGEDAGKGGGGAAPSSGGTSGGSAGQVGNHTNPLTQSVIDAFVAAHNAARARTDLEPPPNPELPPVTWDAVLADSAYNYLSQCEVDSKGDMVVHNDSRTEDYAELGGTDYVGENIYASTGNTVEPGDAVDSWMMEKNQYDYDQGGFENAGHYTQVVWATSVRIGCAIVNCPNARFNNTVLCDYAPGGNISGQKPY